MPEPYPNAPTLLNRWSRSSLCDLGGRGGRAATATRPVSRPDGTYRGPRCVIPSAAQQMKRQRRVVDRDPEAEYAAYVEQAWGTLVRAAVFLGALPHEAEDLA